MKRFIKITACLLALSILTGCEQSQTNSPDNTTSLSSENTSDSAVTPTKNAVSKDNASKVTPGTDSDGTFDDSKPEMEIKLSSELEEIMNLFGEFGKFYYEYCGSDSAWDHITTGEGADSFENENGIHFGKVVNAEIKTYGVLTEKLKSMLTDKCIEDTSKDILDWFGTNENDDLYVRNRGAGGYLGYDYLRINSIGYPEVDTIALDMSRVGEKENWDYEEDLTEDFRITLKKTDNGLRIDEMTGNPLDFAALELVVYNNVYMVLDNVPEYAEKIRKESGLRRTPGETEEIIKLLENYGNLYWGMFPLNDLPEDIVDTSQYISAKRGTRDQTFVKVVNGAIRTEESFLNTLDDMLSEKFKKEFLDDPERPFEFPDGDLYITHRGAGGMGLGMDTLYLDSIEYPDDNTILVTVTSFGDKNNWNTDENIKITSTAEIVRTDNGLRINKCDLDTVTDFYFYREIVYGNSSIDI